MLQECQGFGWRELPGRQAGLWSPRFRRKRARFPGANCGRGAALSRPCGCPDAGALASGDQGLVWLLPGLRPGEGRPGP